MESGFYLIERSDLTTSRLSESDFDLVKQDEAFDGVLNCCVLGKTRDGSDDVGLRCCVGG